VVFFLRSGFNLQAMRFDPPILSFFPPTLEAERPIRFTFEQGAFAGHSFAGTLFLCPNPCCGCRTLRFTCRPDPDPSGPAVATSATPPSPLRFHLKVFDRAVDTEVETPAEGLALAHAAVADLQLLDWQHWTEVFLATKRSQMKTMDLDTVAAWLPPEVLSGQASMVGYAEVFPSADELRLPLAGDTWIVDDQYCVDADCGCQTTILSFIRLPQAQTRRKRTLRIDAVLRHDYIRDRSTVEERRFRSPDATQFMTALRTAHPDCNALFQKRHRELRYLARRLTPAGVRNARRAPRFPTHDVVPGPSLPPPPLPAKVPVKPGRNDPCPCGSGRKYKKCCGR
jgi:hypothetical protein